MTFFSRTYSVLLKSIGKTLAVKTIILLLTTIAMFYVNVAWSQNPPQRISGHRISGQVTDISTGETLVGATVKVQGADNSVTVDGTGKFLITASSWDAADQGDSSVVSRSTNGNAAP